MTDSKYRKLLSQHVEFIEKKCAYAVRIKAKEGNLPLDSITVENESLELSNRVMDLLIRDDYKALRQFKGKSTLKTYLSMIIANRMVEMIRKRRGRDRSNEKAKKYGPDGLLLHQKVTVEGKSPEEAYEELNAGGSFSLGLDQCREIIRDAGAHKRSGDPAYDPLQTTVKPGTLDTEKDRLIVPDVTADPEEQVIAADAQTKRAQVIGQLMEQLSGKDRLILRMRFPPGEEEQPMAVDEIAGLLKLKKKAVYMRISRALEKARTILEQAEINFSDLFP